MGLHSNTSSLSWTGGVCWGRSTRHDEGYSYRLCMIPVLWMKFLQVQRLTRMISYPKISCPKHRGSAVDLDPNIHGGTTTIEIIIQNGRYALANTSTMNTGFVVLEHNLPQSAAEAASGYTFPDTWQKVGRCEQLLMTIVHCCNFTQGKHEGKCV